MASSSQEDLYHLACHEAGHAVMEWWLGSDLKATVVWLGDKGGQNVTPCNISDDGDRLLWVLGGPVAEKRSREDVFPLGVFCLPPDDSDGKKILLLTRRLAGKAPPLRKQVEHQRAVVRVLRQAWPAVVAIADSLLAQRAGPYQPLLAGPDLIKIMTECNVPRRESEVQE